MIKVAVTGNMGSGKSSVCKVFECLGVPVFYADAEAKKLYSNTGILKILTDKFGSGILAPDLTLNKKALAEIIFKDKSAIEFVNQLIHPMVFSLFDDWCKNIKDKPYCIQEAALIFESGSYKKFDRIIVVHAPESDLIERTIKRDKISDADARKRLQNQLPQEEKIAKAHYTILNDNSRLIIPVVLQAHQSLSKINN